MAQQQSERARILGTERAQYIQQHRAGWLANLPLDFHSLETYALYDTTKTPLLASPIMANGARYPANGRNDDKLVVLSYAQQVLAARPDAVVGPALHLRPLYNIICIDLDDPHKAYANALASPLNVLTPEDLAAARDYQLQLNEWILQTFRTAGALCLRSQSGNGIHIFCRYAITNEGINIRFSNGKFKFCGEFFAHSQFIYLTGEPLPDSRQFTANDLLPDLTQLLIDTLSHLKNIGQYTTVETGSNENGSRYALGTTEENGRLLGLTDDEVIARLSMRTESQGSYHFLTHGVPKISQSSGRTDVSLSVDHAVGDLDKISGDPEQVRRILLDSAGIHKNPYNGTIQQRIDKTISTFPASMRKSRQSVGDYYAERNVLNATAEHLKSVLGAGPNQPAPAPVAHAPQQLSGVLDWLRSPIGNTPCQMAPGMSMLVDANEAAMKLPFRKFAEISTVAFFGALLARLVKSRDGLSTSVFTMLAAPTGAGKGEALGFWPAVFQRNRDVTQEACDFVFNGSAASAQALHIEVQERGTTIHYRPDAGGDVLAITRPTGATQTMLRDRLYEFYDASKFGSAAVSPVSSVAGRGPGRSDRTIYSPAFTPVWSMTPTAFLEAYSEDALATGLGSRVLVCLHDEHGGDPVPDSHVQSRPPQIVTDWVRYYMACVKTLDMKYKEAESWERGDGKDEATKQPAMAHNCRREAEAMVWQVNYTDAAAEMVRTLELRVNDVARGVNSKKLPPHYAMFVRIAMQAKKLALLSSIMCKDVSGGLPLSGVEDRAGGIDYAVRCMGDLAHAFDSGVAGDSSDAKRREAMLSWLASALKSKDKEVVEGWLTLRQITQRASMNRAFKHPVLGTDEVTKRVLRTLIEQDQVQVSTSGKSTKYKLV